jgi:prepilin-type processing-associated H-X9-DG protein
MTPRGFGTNPTTQQLANAYVEGASSAHPGGANFCMADGSVKFIKETIDCWAMDRTTGTPLGITGDWDYYSTLFTEVTPARWGAVEVRGGEPRSGEIDRRNQLVIRKETVRGSIAMRR